MTDRIVVSSDHEGFSLKNDLKSFLEKLGYKVVDVGTYGPEPVDYPLFTFTAAQKVASGECARGIIFCGTGQGDAIAANKVPGIRAALCWDVFTARYSRAHNDANILVLGGWIIGCRLAEEIIKVWLTAPFEGGRHQQRLDEIAGIENEMLASRGRVFDISPVIRPGMLTWPGDRQVEITATNAAGINRLSFISLSSHTGSHVDAPVHIIAGGSGAAALNLETMLGMARICHLPGIPVIDRQVLKSLNIEGVTRLILGTANKATRGEQGNNFIYTALTADAAHYLIEAGVKLLAVDSLSVDDINADDYPVHHALLENNIVVVEGIELGGVPAGDYELLCLPLKIEGGDGAPARLVLRELR